MESDNKQLITEDGTILEQVPYMSQDYADMMDSLDAAIEARAIAMAQLEEFALSVIRELEARGATYMREPLVSPAYGATLVALRQLVEASKS